MVCVFLSGLGWYDVGFPGFDICCLFDWCLQFVWFDVVCLRFRMFVVW